MTSPLLVAEYKKRIKLHKDILFGTFYFPFELTLAKLDPKEDSMYTWLKSDEKQRMINEKPSL